MLCNSLTFQAALADYTNVVLHSLPRHCLLGSLHCLPLSVAFCCFAKCMYCIDGSGKTGKVAVVWRQTDCDEWASDVLHLSGSTPGLHKL